MYKDIIEARYTNEQQDTILALCVIESNEIIEEYIQLGTEQHKALEEHGWSEEKIIEATVEFKKSQLAYLVDIAKSSASELFEEEKQKAEQELEKTRRRIVEAEALYRLKSAELDKIRHKTIAAEALHKMKTAEFQEQQKKSLEAHAVVKKIENEAPEKIRSINKYVNDNLTTEKLETALENFLVFVKTVNDNQEAIDILVKKSDKKIKPKTVLDAVKHLL